MKLDTKLGIYDLSLDNKLDLGQLVETGIYAGDNINNYTINAPLSSSAAFIVISYKTKITLLIGIDSPRTMWGRYKADSWINLMP